MSGCKPSFGSVALLLEPYVLLKLLPPHTNVVSVNHMTNPCRFQGVHVPWNHAQILADDLGCVVCCFVSCAVGRAGSCWLAT
jgi:hypothetical protein